MKFYDRETELKNLERMGFLAETNKHMVIITGRRRIGKTRLIKEFIDGKNAFYFFIDRTNSNLLLQHLSMVLKNKLGDRIVGTLDWDEAFKSLINHFDIIVLDEFQNIFHVDRGALSILQRIWDNNDKPVLLVLIGSYIGLMKKVFEDYKSPLYGRSSGRLIIKPLNYMDVREILRDLGYKGEETFITTYSILGGVPLYYEYLESFNPDKNWRDVITTLFLQEPHPLYDEPIIILTGEFGKEQQTYMSILEAIATGRSSMTEICNDTGISLKSIGKYLKELRQYYEIIERKLPIFEHPSSKKSRYFIEDNLLRFWFRFIHRNRNYLEIGDIESIIEIINNDITQYTSQVFEKIVSQIILKNPPFKITNIGQWWSRRGDEIDIIAANKHTKDILFCECKWRNRKIDYDVVEDLKRKASLVKWYNEKRKEYFMVVSKSGFTKNCLNKMSEENIIYWDLKDIKNIIEGSYDEIYFLKKQ